MLQTAGGSWQPGVLRFLLITFPFGKSADNSGFRRACALRCWFKLHSLCYVTTVPIPSRPQLRPEPCTSFDHFRVCLGEGAKLRTSRINSIYGPRPFKAQTDIRDQAYCAVSANHIRTYLSKNKNHIRTSMLSLNKAPHIITYRYRCRPHTEQKGTLFVQYISICTAFVYTNIWNYIEGYNKWMT